MTVDTKRLDGMAGGARHQGVVAMADEMSMPQFIEDVLETLDEPPLLLLLDGVQDPHNLGACLRVADGAGAHAVIAPKDRSCGLTTAAIKVASGAAETVPYIVVTNLARTMRDLKERGIWMVGTADDAPQSLWQAKLDGALGLVLGAEGEGLQAPDPRHLRPPRLHPDDGVGRKPERFRGERCLPLRSPKAQEVAM